MPKLFKSQQQENTRTQYSDPSNKFVDWVNELGIEKTFLGKYVYFLEEKFKVRRLVLVVLFSFIMSVLVSSNFDFVYTGYQTGDVISSDIKSPLTFEFIDEVETAVRKKKAEDLVPPVYDYELNTYEPILNALYLSFREMRRSVAAIHWPSDIDKREEKIKDFLSQKEKFEKLLGSKEVPIKVFEWLTQQKFSVAIENTFNRLLERVSNQKIIHDLTEFEKKDLKQVVVRVVERGGGGQEFTTNVENVRQLHEAREGVTLENVRLPSFLNSTDKNHIIKFTERLIVPNLTPNKQETANRKQKARETVAPVLVQIQKNQTVIAEGTVVQPYHERILDEIRKRNSDGQQDFDSLTLAIFFVSLILVFFSYVRRFSFNKIKVHPKDLAIMGTVSIVVVVIAKIFLFLVVETLQDRYSVFIPSQAYKYLVPIAAGPMLVGLLIFSGEVVWIFTAFLVTALAVMMDYSFTYFVVAFIGGIAGARGVYSCKKRNDLYFAGLRVGLVNCLIIALVTLLANQVETGISLFQQVFWNCLAGFISGVLSSFITMTFIPLLETMFDSTTDVKLLELSNLNHPLLKEMSVKALGTYHHSLVVGSMVETAAEDIGANSLLGRVACYYHDIGKTEHSNYFIENQRPNNNPHDHLSPHMSRTILVAHVKDGVELGVEYKLGKPIIDVIQQHHGTTLISFFFNRALENQDETLGAVSEEEFRYPGPKPQFKEAALCMLADSIEAAARVLDEPHPMRIKNLVKTIIQRKFMDGQLDECNLTLRDLSIIENCFVRVLMGIYHQRVDYPKHLGGVGK